MRARIRRARTADAPTIVELEKLFPSDRMSARSVRRFIGSPGAAVLVATGGERCLGALVLLTRKGSGVARIYSLAVHPDARGQGLAKRLVRQAEAAAREAGCTALALEVRRDNQAARALYAGLGYVEAERLPGYYDDGAPGLRLRRLLGPVAKRGPSKQNTVKQPFSRRQRSKARIGTR